MAKTYAMPVKYIDFHNHSNRSNSNVVSVRSFFVDEFIENTNYPYHCTVGIHPWQSSDDNISSMLSNLEQISFNPNVIAIGEIGLDKLMGADMVTQIELFKKQLIIAEKAQKPVVIHCVRTFSEIQQLRKQLKPTTNWVIHNFMGNAQTAKLLTQQGFFLSFGIAIAKSPKLCEALKSTPIERFFFETDNFIDNVEEVYKAAAITLEIDINELRVRVEKNFEEFFGVTPQ